jgi:hypothetical protein
MIARRQQQAGTARAPPRGRFPDRGVQVQSLRCRALSEGLRILPPVHEPVDDLCKKTVNLCAGGEMLGIAAESRSYIGLLPGRTPLTPCA